MTELLSGLDKLLGGFQAALPFLKIIAVVAGLALGLIAFAAGAYAVEKVFRPLMAAARWMFAYTSGEKPNEIVAGISYAARMLAWAGLVMLAVWIFVQWRFAS